MAGAFIAEAIPALFVFAIRRHLPESPRWLEESGHKAEAFKVINQFEHQVRLALKGKELPEPKVIPKQKANAGGPAIKQILSGKYLRRTLMLWSVWFFALFGYYGLTTWLGALLEASGFTMTKSTLYIAFISSGGVPGFFCVAWFLEKYGRKPAMVISLVGCAVAAYFYGTANSFVQVISCGLMLQFFLYGMWAVLYAYTPELYPTQIRATGSGITSSVGRTGALIGPYLIGAILPAVGQVGVFEIGAGAFIAAAIITLIFGEETKGKVLEEI